MRQTNSDIMANVPVAADVRPKRVANNTVRYQHADGTTRWRLHNTDIVTRDANGVFTLNTGGWKTVTTKERINTFAPVDIWSERGTWFVGTSKTTSVPFFDGMRVASDGKPLDPPAIDATAANKKLRKDINAFCKLVDTVPVLPHPELGDCLLCMVAAHDSGQQGGRFGVHSGMSKATHTDHLASHIEEGYLHGTLLVNAMRAAGYRDDQIGVHYAMANGRNNTREFFKRALRRYLLRAFGMQA